VASVELGIGASSKARSQNRWRTVLNRLQKRIAAEKKAGREWTIGAQNGSGAGDDDDNDDSGSD